MDGRKTYPDELTITYDIVEQRPRKKTVCRIDKLDIKVYIVTVHLVRDEDPDEVIYSKHIKLHTPMVINGKRLSKIKSFYSSEYCADETVYEVSYEDIYNYFKPNVTLSLVESEQEINGGWYIPNKGFETEWYESKVLAVRYEEKILYSDEEENYSFMNAASYRGVEISEPPKHQPLRTAPAKEKESTTIVFKVLLYGLILYFAVMIYRGLMIVLGE